MPDYLSPSALMLWLEKPKDYYTRYMTTVRAPREPQNEAMALGSGFDAFVKDSLSRDLGQNEFELETLYAGQVEPHMQSVIRRDSERLFGLYRDLGAYNDLLLDMVGKVDIFDFKTTGYYSQYSKSPKKGYIRQRSGLPRFQSRHKNVVIGDHHGIKYNTLYTLDEVDRKWALQLVTYSWLMGVDVDVSVLAGVEELVGYDVRICQHRCMIPASFGLEVWDKYADLWDRVRNGWFFRELSRDESDDICERLESAAVGMSGMVGW